MRAMGAGRGFVMNMIIMENLMISGMFGLLGIVFGSLIILFLNLTGIIAPNIFFEILFGGKVLYPELSMYTVVQALGTIFIISILSSIYPVIIALRIKPVRAMSE
jgi:putative ABC transport system permease protein